MPITPTTRERLADTIADLVMARPTRVRLAIDGPPPTAPTALAEEVAVLLRSRGRATLVIEATDFLRPASIRLEHGREDPDELLDTWLDEAALRREVLDPAAPEGTGRVLPKLWNPHTDRAYRAGYQNLPTNGVVILAGALLLGRGLPVDVTAHLKMSRAALTRHIPEPEHWTLPAYTRYDRDHHPATTADVLILSDHPERPAHQT